MAWFTVTLFVLFLSRIAVGNFFSVRNQIVSVSLGGPFDLCLNDLILLLNLDSCYRLYINEWAWLCSNKTLLSQTGGGLALA